MHEHRLAAIMFSDIAGYTSLMGKDEERAIDLLRQSRKIHKPIIKKYQGMWIKEMGDAILARFDSAYNATRCALEIQLKALETLNGKLRIGLHMGEIIDENGDIFGDGVNVASRIQSLAVPCSIYLSETLCKTLHNRRDIKTRFLAEVKLKNVEEPVKIFCLRDRGLKIPHRNNMNSRDSNRGKVYEIWQQITKPVFMFPTMLILTLLIIFQYLSYNVTKSEKVSMAVLPFISYTENAEEQFFADMMQEAVIRELSKNRNLLVRSRTSMLQFKDSEFSRQEIAKILKVDIIMESSIYSINDSVLLRLQLMRIRPAEDHIWTLDIKKDKRYLVSNYNKIAKQIAREMAMKLTIQHQKRFAHSN